MAVNVGQRNVPDTPANRQLEACEKAMELALHTIKICQNKKIFKAEYQDALTDDIIRCAKNIYVYAWTGNNVDMRNGAKRWPERERLQLAAISKCNELLALINVAKRLFHLRHKKEQYWSKMARDTRAVLGKWHEANKKQYGT